MQILLSTRVQQERKDIEDLIKHIKKIVFKETKIKLIPEVEIIGDV
jgi:UDP-N-acetylenolpyruvoylglucosamine reductase